MSSKIRESFDKSYRRIVLKPYRDLMGRLKSRYPVNYGRIEIEITTHCNLKCFNCNRSCRQAPSNEHMTINQLRSFLNETIQTNKQWKELHLIGGEPTLHKDIFEICNIFLDFKNTHAPRTKVFVVTNGFGPKVNDVLLRLPEGIDVINSSKKTPAQSFDTYNIAPIDLDNYKNKNIDFSAGCWVMEDCGMALTRYGYYCCGPGASVDRVFNFGIGIKELGMVTEEAMRNQARILCQYCGLFKRQHRHAGSRNEDHGYYNKEQTSQSWKDVYKKYNEKKPELSVY
jgi:hypothetical protein